jgi:heat shock protein HslJ
MRLRPIVLTLATLSLLAAAPGCRSSAPGAPPPPAAVEGEAASIENRTWRLARLPGRDVTGEPPHFRLRPADGRVEGDGGCNRFGGSYELSGDSLRMGPLMSTKRACVDEARGAQETALLQALERTHGWRLEEERLLLLDEEGAEVARFVGEAR